MVTIAKTKFSNLYITSFNNAYKLLTNFFVHAILISGSISCGVRLERMAGRTAAKRRARAGHKQAAEPRDNAEPAGRCGSRRGRPERVWRPHGNMRTQTVSAALASVPARPAVFTQFCEKFIVMMITGNPTRGAAGQPHRVFCYKRKRNEPPAGCREFRKILSQ